MTEEHEGIVAGRQERLEPGGPAGQLGRVVAGPAQAQVQEAARSPDRRRLVELVEVGRAQDRADRASAANVSSTCQDGSWNSTVSGRSSGQRAEQGGQLVVIPRSMFVGTRNRTVPRRSPNSRRGVVSHGTEVAGSTVSARRLPPRWALTANRKVAGVAASQPAIAASVGLR